MSNDPVRAKALARLSHHEAEAAKIREWLRTYDEIAGDNSATPAPLKAAVAPLPAAPPSAPATQSAAVPSSISPTETIVWAKSILDAAQRPVRLGDLYNTLTSWGIEFPGKNPINTFGARLSNSPELVPIPGFGWWFADRPYAPAGYLPSGNTTAGEKDPPAAGDLL